MRTTHISYLKLLRPSSSSFSLSLSTLQTLIPTMDGSAGEEITSNSVDTLPVTVDPLSVTPPDSQINGEPTTVTVDTPIEDDVKFGFQRSEMFSTSLSGTVDPYARHLFLCYQSPESWPSNVEGKDGDVLPRSFAAALKSQSEKITGKTRLTICEGRNGTDFSNGDVLIFPEMVRYKGLTHLEVEKFVEDVLVNSSTWASGTVEPLKGSYVFVCSHGSRDKRCGVCGPALIEKFKEEIGSRGMVDQVFVSACSHVGGHKYAGNLIIFSPDSSGKLAGHWYGYVTPDDVPTLLDEHIGKGNIIEKLWRGQMVTLNPDEVKPTENGDSTLTNGDKLENTEKEPQGSTERDLKDEGGCCQGANGFSCCRDEKVELKNVEETAEVAKTKVLDKVSAWMGKWEQNEVLAAAAVVGAVATIGVAYSFYRRSG